MFCSRVLIVSWPYNPCLCNMKVIPVFSYQSYLADLVPSVFGSLNEHGYFYDPVERGKMGDMMSILSFYLKQRKLHVHTSTLESGCSYYKSSQDWLRNQ